MAPRKLRTRLWGGIHYGAKSNDVLREIIEAQPNGSEICSSVFGLHSSVRGKGKGVPVRTCKLYRCSKVFSGLTRRFQTQPLHPL
jgi:hypothetical protein